MNPATLIGMLGGIALLVGVVYVSAEDAQVFLNLPGLGLVVGGTLAATLVSYPLGEVLRVFRVFTIVLRNEKLYAEQDIKELVEVAKLVFQGDIAKTEDHLNRIKNPFLRTGVQLVVDGTPMNDILAILQWRIGRLRARERAEAQIFHTLASFAPAFGMLGTLLGLVNMLHGMGADDIGVIGRNMGLAMITTLYGIVLANMFFKPVALKLERRTEQRVMLMNMVLEGVMLIHDKRSPAFINETLNSFVAHYEDEIRGGAGSRSTRSMAGRPRRA